MAASVSMERQARCYLAPKLHVLFTGYVISEEMGMSESLNIMVRDFFNRLPKDKLEKYQKAFSEKQKANEDTQASWPV